jgi:chloramphenicol O-acetyltransferase type B
MLIKKLLSRLYGKLFPPRLVPLAERYPMYQIGRGSYGELHIESWKGEGSFRMGAYCSVARGAKVLLGGEHRLDWVTTFPFNVLWESARHITGHPSTKGEVVIGNDVWIGTEALITSGVTIHDGAVVGARAVVTKDVPPYAIVAGSPARVVRYRFPEHVISRLLETKWWEWDEGRIAAAMPDLLSPDAEVFLAKANRNEYVSS